jgi:copper chaperone CopZ
MRREEDEMQTTLRFLIVVSMAAGLAAPILAGGRPDTVRTVFTVEGMHCDSCSSTITATLERIDGVTEASADHEKGLATAVYHPRKVKVEDLKEAIEKLGYTVTGMTTETVEG